MKNRQKGSGEGGGQVGQHAPEQRDKACPLPLFAKRTIRNAIDARKMLARLIHGFQLGQIDSYEAKTLCYLIVSYCRIVKDTEIEERLKKLEERILK